MVLGCLFLGFARPGCPNNCNRHGTCDEYDMCSCFPGWQGNDCKLMSCPLGFAHISTPQGDLNLDGDLYDNSHKKLVQATGGRENWGTLRSNDNVLTLEAAMASNELVVGDIVRLGPAERATVTAILTPTTVKLLRALSSGVPAPGVPVYHHLENIRHPRGTWESWKGDYFQGGDEGHFYMECSNRGSCDHKKGRCDCSPGFTGGACERMQCPVARKNGPICGGRGTCESVGSLAESRPIQMAWTVQATSGSTDVFASADPAAHISSGDMLKIGHPHAPAVEVRAVDASTGKIELVETFNRTFPFGTLVFLRAKYDLWDRDKNFACKCDNDWFGPSCRTRSCPGGQDPLNDEIHRSTAAGAKLDGASAFVPRNERQTISLDTMRGELSGSFRLGFTDVFGALWWTKPIDVNARLPSKARVLPSPQTDRISFDPPLTAEDLDVGDFLAIHNERQEVVEVWPAPGGSSRPAALAGVVNSVRVRYPFQQYDRSGDGVPAFRAGPARGIRAALMDLPQSLVADCEAETFNSGTLVGYAAGGVAVSGSTVAGGMFAKRSTLKMMYGVFSPPEIRTVVGNTVGANADPVGARAGPAERGGLLPYDTIRVVNEDGTSSFLQVQHVDHALDHAWIDRVVATGSTASIAAASTLEKVSIGLAAGRTGAVYRAGGHSVRVAFTTNPGNLPEMDCNGEDLHSVFVRDFTATVTAATPSRVDARTFAGVPVQEATAYPYPNAGGADLGKSNQGGIGHRTHVSHLGHHLRVAPGMCVRVGGQQRTVVTPMVDGSFYVDSPFVVSSIAERGVDNVPYLFYRERIEQVYDDGVYSQLGVPQGLPDVGESAAFTVSITNAGVLTMSIAGAATPTSVAAQGGVLTDRFSLGEIVMITGSVANDGAHVVVAVTAPPLGDPSITLAGQADAVLATTYTAEVDTPNVALRKYDPMGFGSARGLRQGCGKNDEDGTCLTSTSAQPPLKKNRHSNWCNVADQRPIRWAGRRLATLDGDGGKARVHYSKAGVKNGAVSAAGGATRSVSINDGKTTIAVAPADAAANIVFTISGTTPALPSLTELFGTCTGTDACDLELWATGPASVVQKNRYQKGGASVGYLGMCRAVLVSDSAIKCEVARSTIPAVAGTISLLGKTFGVSNVMPGLVDPKTVVLGDRIKIRRGLGDYETRTVFKTWGTGMDTTMFSVEDPFSDLPAGGLAAHLRDEVSAWVDESGTTEHVQCSRRGICNEDFGACECFPGFGGGACEKIAYYNEDDVDY